MGFCWFGQAVVIVIFLWIFWNFLCLWRKMVAFQWAFPCMIWICGWRVMWIWRIQTLSGHVVSHSYCSRIWPACPQQYGSAKVQLLVMEIGKGCRSSDRTLLPCPLAPIGWKGHYHCSLEETSKYSSFKWRTVSCDSELRMEALFWATGSSQ
jgi:hypothetical protein